MEAIWKAGRYTKTKFRETYESDTKTEKVSWHHKYPTAFLKEATEARAAPTNALDIGCGLGTDSVYLAKQGWNVTSLDFVTEALDATSDRAAEAGVEVNCIEADILKWSPGKTFDLIVDAGCMHNLDRSALPAYKAKLLELMAPDADLVLAHWESLNAFDWRPVGPYRVSKKKVVAYLEPEFELKDFNRRVVKGLSFMVGPTLSIAFYWFQRRAR